MLQTHRLTIFSKTCFQHSRCLYRRPALAKHLIFHSCREQLYKITLDEANTIYLIPLFRHKSQSLFAKLENTPRPLFFILFIFFSYSMPIILLSNVGEAPPTAPNLLNFIEIGAIRFINYSVLSAKYLPFGHRYSAGDVFRYLRNFHRLFQDKLASNIPSFVISLRETRSFNNSHHFTVKPDKRRTLAFLLCQKVLNSGIVTR